MIQVREPCRFILMLTVLLALSACERKESASKPQELPDLNEQMRPYVTVENTKVRTGPGTQFRTIGEIKQNSKVQVVGKDGEWALIVSKKGNAPGYIELGAVKPGTGEEQESPAASVEGKYETVANTQVRSGPGLQHPVVAQVKKGLKLNVVSEENGWLKVESKTGKPPGYVDASLARPVKDQQSVGRQ
jgi:N-acetylmuramoyl-L-alanine amidase